MDTPEKWSERRRRLATHDTTTLTTADQLHPQTVSGRAFREELAEHFESHDGGERPPLTAQDIPDLPASKISSGTFDAARVPDLSADRISSGTFAAARIPTLAQSKVSGLQDALAALEARLEALEGGDGGEEG